jgi:hypothetical protein
MADNSKQDMLFIWLDTNPESSQPELAIEDTPGIPDLDLIAAALVSGHLGRYLPVTIRFASHPDPQPNKVRSVDTARMLRDRSIAHRRRYEIIQPAGSEDI